MFLKRGFKCYFSSFAGTVAHQGFFPASKGKQYSEPSIFFSIKCTCYILSSSSEQSFMLKPLDYVNFQ